MATAIPIPCGAAKNVSVPFRSFFGLWYGKLPNAALDFVMAGQNNYQEPDISFPADDIALARSTNIRTGQKWPDGSDMDDRVINHLRVFKKIDGEWLCIHHMISQAHDRRP